MCHIHTAAREGRLKLLARKISEGLKDQHHPTSNSHETPLHAAVEGGSIEAVKMLIASSVSLDELDGEGKTALYYAAALGKTDAITLLLEAGSNPEIFSRSYASTPLMAAIIDNNEDAVRVLLGAGVQINYSPTPGYNKNGYETPLHGAIYHDQGGCLKALLECERTDYEIRNCLGQTVEECFSKFSSNNLTTYRQAKEKRELAEHTDRVLRGNINPFPSGFQGVFGLMLDKRWIDYQKLDRDKTARNNEGQTTLHFAASLGRADIVECLLKMGSDPWAYDCEGWTALDMALDTECLTLIDEQMCAVGKPPPLPKQTVSSRKRM